MKTNPAKGNVGKFMTMDWKTLRKTLNILGSENCSDYTRTSENLAEDGMSDFADER